MAVVLLIGEAALGLVGGGIRLGGAGETPPGLGDIGRIEGAPGTGACKVILGADGGRLICEEG